MESPKTHQSSANANIIRIIGQMYDVSFSKVDYLNRETVEKLTERSVNDLSRFLYTDVSSSTEEFERQL